MNVNNRNQMSSFLLLPSNQPINTNANIIQNINSNINSNINRSALTNTSSVSYFVIPSVGINNNNFTNMVIQNSLQQQHINTISWQNVINTLGKSSSLNNINIINNIPHTSHTYNNIILPQQRQSQRQSIIIPQHYNTCNNNMNMNMNANIPHLNVPISSNPNANNTTNYNNKEHEQCRIIKKERQSITKCRPNDQNKVVDQEKQTLNHIKADDQDSINNNINPTLMDNISSGSCQSSTNSINSHITTSTIHSNNVHVSTVMDTNRESHCSAKSASNRNINSNNINSNTDRISPNITNNKFQVPSFMVYKSKQSKSKETEKVIKDEAAITDNNNNEIETSMVNNICKYCNKSLSSWVLSLP